MVILTEHYRYFGRGQFGIPPHGRGCEKKIRLESALVGLARNKSPEGKSGVYESSVVLSAGAQVRFLNGMFSSQLRKWVDAFKPTHYLKLTTSVC